MADYYKERMTNSPPVIGSQVNPTKGGLRATNYNHPYQNPDAEGGGLRVWVDKSGNYQGQMMPKGRGWRGEIPALDGRKTITELSMGGENGEAFFPSVYEGIPDQQVETVRQYEAGNIGLRAPAMQRVMRDAEAAAMRRIGKGLSPFKDLN